MKKKAVILYSGGLDSTTCMAIARDQGFAPYAISFAYGQRHAVELQKAREYAPRIGAVEHLVVDFDLRRMGGSALTADLAVPKDGVKEGEIPVTYVPARNTIFLSFALGWAEVLGAFDLFIGVNALDYSGYPDCRPEYIAAYQAMANLATRAGVEGAGRYTDPHPAHRPDQSTDHPPRPGTRRRLRPDPFLLRPDPAGARLRHLRFLPAAPQGVRRGGRAGPGPLRPRG